MNPEHFSLQDRIANSPGGDKDSKFNTGGFANEIRVDSLELKYQENEDFKNFVDNLTDTEKILDLGAGLGSAVIRFLKKINKAENVISLDLDINNIAARVNHPESELPPTSEGNDQKLNKEFVLSDAHSLPFEKASFDVIAEFYMRLDNETQNFDLIINEVKRVLKPNGYYLTNENLLTNQDPDFKLITEISFDCYLYQYDPN